MRVKTRTKQRPKADLSSSMLRHPGISAHPSYKRKVDQGRSVLRFEQAYADSTPPFPTFQLPLSHGDFHQQFLVLDRNPTRQDFHCVLEIAVEKDLPRAVDQRCARCVQDIETTGKGPVFVGWEAEVRVAEEHEDVPDTELGWEGDGVVEEGEIPACAVGCGIDVEFGLEMVRIVRSLV